MGDLAFISNEPTPYRLHLLERLTNEQPALHVHAIFTHTLDKAHVPWDMNMDQLPRPVFFEKEALGQTQSPRQCYRLFKQIRNYLIEQKIQLVILNGYADLTRLLLLRWAHKQGLPVVLRGDSNIHGQSHLPSVRRWVKRRVLGWIGRHIAGLMPMGRCGEAFFEYWMPNHRLPMFFCPYEPNYQAIADCSPEVILQFLQDHQLDPTRQRLLYCGRLIDVKCVDVLLDAFTRVADSQPNWDLVIAGTGECEDSLKNQVPEALKARVHFLGFLQFEQTIACYHCCDVLVHPPRYEPWALVINEAVAAGLAVIATHVTGAATELVHHNHNGLQVEPDDVDQLTEAILRMTQGQTAKHMGQASVEVLAAWQAKADPVAGIVQAMDKLAPPEAPPEASP